MFRSEFSKILKKKVWYRKENLSHEPDVSETSASEPVVEPLCQTMGKLQIEPDSEPPVSELVEPQPVLNKPLKKHFRLLTGRIPRLKYQNRARDMKKVLHWGQRKLLMTEIEFLCRFYKLFEPVKKVYIIYAGAAAGTHLILLKELFPDIYLELYDSNAFDKNLKNLSNVNMYNRYFFDSDAELWQSDKHPDKHILLISDIRTADTENMSSEKIELCVKADHKMQKGWYDIMEPEFSMFKFRLPWDDCMTRYMKGRIYIQPWAPITSTETRLMVLKNAPLVSYDNRDYEERMFHHNIYEREAEYTNILEDMPREKKGGLDNRFDAVTEIRLLEDILGGGDLKSDIGNIIDWSKHISSTMGKRTLFDDNPLKKEKSLVLKMKRLSMIPKNAPLTQGTYNKYVIPQWDKLTKMKLVEGGEMFTRSSSK